MIFSHNRELPAILPLKIFGKATPRVNSIKFLGVIVDNKLNGKNHFLYLVKKILFYHSVVTGWHLVKFSSAAFTHSVSLRF